MMSLSFDTDLEADWGLLPDAIWMLLVALSKFEGDRLLTSTAPKIFKLALLYIFYLLAEMFDFEVPHEFCKD